MTFADIIRAAIPGASDGDCDYVLWGRTPYPCGPVDARSLYRAARGAYRAGQKGLMLCDCCHRVALPDCSLCQLCWDAIGPERNASAHADRASAVSEPVTPESSAARLSERGE